MEESDPVVAKIRLTKGFDGKFQLNLEKLQDMNRQHTGLKGIRGNVIEITIDIEYQFNLLISNLLFGGDNNRASTIPHETKGEIRFFEDFILNTNHMPFGAKIKIFRSLYKRCSFLKKYEQDCKKLASDLQNVVEWRDRFAHGSIQFKATKEGISNEPYLFYYADNEPKEQVLNNEFFNEIINPRFNKTYNQLTDLRGKVNGLFQSEQLFFDFD